MPAESVFPPRWTRSEQYLLAAAVMVCLVTAAVVVVGGRDLVRSDAAGYLRWSRHWWDFDNRVHMHMPLYVVCLWLGRSVSLGWLDNTPLLMVLSLGFGGWALVVAQRLLRKHFPTTRPFGFALLTFYPLVGLSWAYNVRPDALALLCLLGTSEAILDRRWLRCTLFMGAGLLTHKALWPFLVLLGIYALWQRRCPFWWLLLACCPLGAYWLWGLAHGQEVLWLVRENVAVEFATHSGWPLLDGVFGTLLARGSTIKLVKGLLMLGLLTLTVVLLIWLIRAAPPPDLFFHLALVVPVLLLLVLLNQYEIFAALRFSQIMSIPLAVMLVSLGRDRQWWRNPTVLTIFVALAAASELAFCYYSLAVFPKP